MAESDVPPSTVGVKLAPFNPSHDEVVEIALDLMKLRPDDVLYDLGCGDARILVKACHRFPSIRAVGVEYDLAVYEKATKLVNDHNLGQIILLHDNVLNVDFDSATAIFVYLLPEGMKQLKDKFVSLLDRGVRIVSYVFSIPDIAPAKIELYKSATKIYLYENEVIRR
eukprot:gene29598-35731_t